MFLDGDKKDVILNPELPMFTMLMVTVIPSMLLGIYWSPLANWVKSSLVFYIQTI
jgi:hypothetical protein